MSNPSRVPLLLLCTALVMGCSGDGVLEPSKTLLVQPYEALLYVEPPDNTLQLTVQAPRSSLSLLNGEVTYSSSAPSIASVSNSGLVTALAPGAATITVTQTRGRNQETAFMRVRVGWGAIGGFYHLDAPITEAPVMGGFTEARFTAVLNLWRDPDHGAGILGAFSDLQLGDGEWSIPMGNGEVTSRYAANGRPVIVLATDDGDLELLTGTIDVASSTIQGTFSAPEPLANGPFTATRVSGVEHTTVWRNYGWHPSELNVSPGETVVWVVGDLTGDPEMVWLKVTGGGAGEIWEELSLVDGAARRVMAAPGEFPFCTRCWDPGDFGSIRVR